MSVDWVSPSGLVSVRLPRSKRGRWRIAVRGTQMATGRGFDALGEALDRVADLCAASPGLGGAAMEIRSMLDAVERERHDREGT